MGSRRRPRTERSSVDLGLTPRIRNTLAVSETTDPSDHDPLSTSSAAQEQEPATPPSRAPSGQHNTLNRAETKPRTPTGQHPRLTTSGQQPRLATSGQHPRLTTSGQHPRLTTSGQHERLTTSGQHERLITSGQHERVARPSRVELVTRQTDDGSYELVYEEVSEDDGEDVLPPLTLGDSDPIWRRKPMVTAAIVVGVLLIGTLSVVGVATFINQEPKKIAASASDTPTKPSQPSERYEYVPPPKGTQQRIEEENTPNKPEPTTPSNAAPQRLSPKPIGNRALPQNVDLPTTRRPTLNERPNIHNGLKPPTIPSANKELLREALERRQNKEQPEDEDVIEESEEIPEEALEEPEGEPEDNEEAPEGEELDEEEPLEDEEFDDGPANDEAPNEDAPEEGFDEEPID